ncbi:hypothetical protein KR51_00014290 [Rubidibacter lacunae KORDI 51-2]|uniref:Protein SirB1 N-terminal domain-containing protein n=1 Tax=Rubidibacter lacunae KORDI 51-2 TaxID=582515 RepID=U5DLY3_9CHRO|nr:transglutaminase-like domain-containing protein [Rubidibacter lacunae]ERN41897.1 hypothetical protein KR51_00014290 [Rubidibacter lacunae KORDI 51-2]
MTPAASARALFAEEVVRPDNRIDLARAALYLAQEEYPELDVGFYLARLDEIAAAIAPQLPPEGYPLRVIQCINDYLYDELKFRGNEWDYYDPRNSFLNDVLDRRTGIPISLSLVYAEVARRVGLPVVGVGMPGHFLIRPTFEGAEIFIDAFRGGEILFPEDCAERLQQVYQQPVELQPQFLEPVGPKQVLARMLTNLKLIYLNNRDLTRMLAAVERILLLFPDVPGERRDRGLLNYQLGHYDCATLDLERYLLLAPDADDADQIRRLLGR